MSQTIHKPVYLDHQATTPLDPRVFEAMKPCFLEHFGNASSNEHRFGWVAEEMVEQASQTLVDCLGAAAKSEFIFTSGATESNNLAILGVARALRRKGRHIITAKTEHKAVLDPCWAWEKEGGEVTYLPVNGKGDLDLDRLKAAIKPETILISLMAANNETGVLHPLNAIGQIAREADVLFHSDATQAVGKIPIDLREIPIDLLSFSAHKLYGPKGSGALYIRKRRPRIKCMPLFHGGNHQNGIRSGTLNGPGIVGLAHALRLANGDLDRESQRLTTMAIQFWDALEQLGDVRLNGPREPRLPGNLNFAFDDIPAEKILRALFADLAFSSGSACTTANPEPSHVITAMSGADRAKNSLRIGLGRFTKQEEIDFAIQRFAEVITDLRHGR